MRKQHHASLKWHTIFTALLSIAAVALIFLLPDAAFIVGFGFLVLYIAGNGLIHHKKGTSHRDIWIEYGILVLLAVVLLLGFLLS